MCTFASGKIDTGVTVLFPKNDVCELSLWNLRMLESEAGIGRCWLYGVGRSAAGSVHSTTMLPFLALSPLCRTHGLALDIDYSVALYALFHLFSSV